MLGKLLRGQPLDQRKAKLFVFIIIGFVSGGTLGALLFVKYQFMALLFPIVSCILLAIVYREYAKRCG